MRVSETGQVVLRGLLRSDVGFDVPISFNGRIEHVVQ